MRVNHSYMANRSMCSVPAARWTHPPNLAFHMWLSVSCKYFWYGCTKELQLNPGYDKWYQTIQNELIRKSKTYYIIKKKINLIVYFIFTIKSICIHDPSIMILYQSQGGVNANHRGRVKQYILTHTHFRVKRPGGTWKPGTCLCACR